MNNVAEEKKSILFWYSITQYKVIDIIFTGLRLDGKLYEELLFDFTKNKQTSNSKIYIEEPYKILPMN